MPPRTAENESAQNQAWCHHPKESEQGFIRVMYYLQNISINIEEPIKESTKQFNNAKINRTESASGSHANRSYLIASTTSNNMQQATCKTTTTTHAA